MLLYSHGMQADVRTHAHTHLKLALTNFFTSQCHNWAGLQAGALAQCSSHNTYCTHLCTPLYT
jgi:hypothetical protein